MIQRQVVLTLYRGSDISEALFFKDDLGVALSMIGQQIEIVEAEAWIAAHGAVAWTDQAGGEARLTAPWDSTAPAETWVRFRTKRTADDFDDAFPKIVVRFI